MRAIRLGATAAWGCAVVAGAFVLRYAPPAPGTWLARVMASEPFHIVAHLFLYGTLAALAWIGTRRTWASALIVAVFAVLQEGAQSVWWGRWFGPPEFFDFGVDAVAAAIVLLARGRLTSE